MGKLAVIKTKETDITAEDFINEMKDEQKRKDSFVLLDMMQKATGEKPKVWSNSTIGFGNVRYKSPATGREVDWFKIGFAARKSNLSLHLMGDMNAYSNSLKKLGKHKTGGGCLYINKLDDIDLKVLEEMMRATVKGK